jgi:hypothetical protein
MNLSSILSSIMSHLSQNIRCQKLKTEKETETNSHTTHTQDKMLHKADFGEDALESTELQHLNVKIIQAEGLRNADSGLFGDVSDPYAECWYVH